jgi:NodT family efflux transporter outer membrane factor (OMF) lipoprotein
LHANVSPTPQPDAGDQQQLAVGSELAGQWWQLFQSSVLDAVVRDALTANPSLAAANATLAQARDQVTVARAAWLPSLDASASVQRSGAQLQRASTASSSLYSIGVGASYSLDVFGGTRRAVEQQQALASFQRNQLAAAYLTLTGNVVDQVLLITELRLQTATENELIEIDRKNLALTQRAFAVGIATRADVLTADSQLAADLTQLPTLQKQLDQAYDQLAVLSGRPPAEWKIQTFDIEQFTLPRQIPLSVPARLVQQRPDILAAEAQLHAASAAIGVAISQQLPNISLSAALTREALRAADLFHEFDTAWSAAAALTQPLFRGGALKAQARAAQDAFSAQSATNRAVVLEALGQVADDLWALQYDAQLLTVDRHSMDVALQALNLQQQSYTVGTTNVLSLTTAQRTYAQARLSYVNAQVQQFRDTASLLLALGGGWWNDQIEPPPK